MPSVTVPAHVTVSVAEMHRQRAAQFVSNSWTRPDAAGRADFIEHRDGNGNTLVTYDYQFNVAGDLSWKIDHGVLKNYAYDEHGQLTSDNGTGYSYDLNGNRTNPGYVPGPGNRITSDGVWNYSYDNEGNVSKKVRISDGLTWTYEYDRHYREFARDILLNVLGHQ